MSGQVTKCAKYWLGGQMYEGDQPRWQLCTAGNFTELTLDSKNALCVHDETFSYGCPVYQNPKQ